MTRLLLDNGADANEIGRDGQTPLHSVSASWSQDSSLGIAELLIQYGADVTKANEDPKLRLLLQNGARVNAKSKRGETALHLAAIDVGVTIVRLLLEHGADPALENNRGQTPLQKAAADGQEGMVKFLLQHQGLESDAEKLIQQAQFYNAICQGDEATVKLLLENGIDMTMRNTWGAYPLHWAMGGGNLRVVSLLLQSGADIDAKNGFGESALFDACRRTNEEMMQFLLDQGADINMNVDDRAGHYYSVLSMATGMGKCQIVEMLLRRGANPHVCAT
ncbi:unnamed protein product [Penicillium salamii]|uniref:Uncharacterized protein n=1 Tax=Penicillium salamii TaxID=1612424 RepID=A0A9W4J3B7_9EURO|nr:unnamed protein product [Penicillium salamii]